MRLDGAIWPASQIDRVRQLATDWVETELPAAERGAGVTVRFDNDDPQRWWRLTIDRVVDIKVSGSAIATNAVATTTVTIATDQSGTSFEVRVMLVPGGRRILPSRPDVSTAPVHRLVAQVLNAAPFYDANARVLPEVKVVSSNLGAQEVAAFALAPGRALPVVVETVPTKSTPLFDVSKIAPMLAGLAHIFRIEGDAARAAFHGFYGTNVLLARGLALLWPGRETAEWGGTNLNQVGAEQSLRDCVGRIHGAAQGSLAPLRAPRFQRRLVVPEMPAATPSSTAARAPSVTSERAPERATATEKTEPSVSEAEYRAALDGWQEAYSRIDELEQALAEADRAIDEKNQLLDNRDGLVDQLVLQNTELAIRLGQSPTGLRATSAVDAVRQAKVLCEDLTFHENALTSAERLENVDASRLLEDLVRLNVVARDWKSGRITNSSLTISCRSLGLNYASGISDNAENKFGEDYMFTWRGRTEIAAAHIRNGKGARLYRVHIFFDDDAHQVVVAYVGRHLRDKSTN